MKHHINRKLSFYIYIFIFIAVFLGAAISAQAFHVKNLKAHYSHGQVFLTWHNCAATNLRYNVYRSHAKFTSTSQLNSSTYLGFVRDSSSKNYRLSTLDEANIFYKFRENGQPVKSSKGLYAITCTDNAPFYYAVMVVDLSTGNEEKVILDGKNSLTLPINETIAKPRAVLQDSVETPDNEMKYRYVQFVNNQETPLYPSMNSTGSYGFNFYLIRRGNASSYPMMVLYQSDNLAADAKSGVDKAEFPDGFVLGPDDWLPIQYNNGKFGDNTYWCCYHEDFDIYTENNPKPETGVVKTYTQKRVIEAIRFVRDHFPVDSASVYLRGNSHNGFGALFTAAIYSEEIACVYGIVQPIALGPNGKDMWEKMWGMDISNLISDVPNFKNGQILSFDRLTNLKRMADNNFERSLPVIYDVHGKNDHTDGWNEGKVDWIDSLDANFHGGARYWDQRDHNGDGRDFSVEETTPDFLRYHTTKSYPAFSNCSINQDHGNGKKSSGDPYGAFNGYLDFDDDILDEECQYEVEVFIKDYYVGGVLDPEQYNTCTADIAFRRLQNFKPDDNATIKWKNYDSENDIIQSGSFIYKNKLMIINNLTINKTGNRIELKIQNCSRVAEINSLNEDVDFIKTGTGYDAVIYSEENRPVSISLFDVSGRALFTKNMTLVHGSNMVEIPSPGNGIYVVRIAGGDMSVSRKLLF